MLTMYIFVNYGFKALKKVVIRKSSMNETEDGYLEPWLKTKCLPDPNQDNKH